jgi:predicted Fe-Mo cluster-binding NifX family protein
MKIAVPVENGQLAAHFGRCRQVSVFDVDDETKQIHAQTILAMPTHEPGVFPVWLSKQQVNVVIACGMGDKALTLFEEANIRVVLGAPCSDVSKLVHAFITDQLTSTANPCDHDDKHHCEHESHAL